MDVRIAIPDRHVSEGVLNAGLEAVTRVNEALIKEGSAPTFTEAVKRGVRWAPEPPGHESFDHAQKVIARGWGDCDDLGPYRAGSLRASGQDPLAKSVVYKSGPGRWHAVVQRGDGRLEDPSRTAGMKVRPGTRAAGIAPAVVGAMGRPSVNGAVRPFVAVRRDDQGYLARVDVPIDGADEGDSFLSCVQHGRSPSHALSGCMAGACMVGSASGMVDEDALDKMWAVHGLMKGQSLKQVAQVCGAEAAKDALLTLKALAPDLVEELRKHWNDAAVLRADFDRMRKEGGATRPGAAVPFVGAHRGHHRHPHKGKHRHHHRVHGSVVGWGTPGASYFGEHEPEWASHLAHERVVSPFAERFGHRGRQFVGAATMSPYLEMRTDPSWGTAPRRAFGHEQAFSNAAPIAQVVGWGEPGAVHQDPDAAEWASRLAHERVVSPFAERFGHRGRQFVGAGLPFRPTLSFSLAGEHPGQQGYRSASTVRSPQAQSLQTEIDELVERALRGVHPGALAAAHPDQVANAILSALRAAPLGRSRGTKSPAQAFGSRASSIVSRGNLATAFDRSLHAPEIVGWDLFKDVVAPAAKAVSNVATTVSHVVSQVAPIAQQVLSVAQGVISMVPGIGTGISAAIGAGLAILSGGGPIEIAVKAAYSAIPIPASIRLVTDALVDAALQLLHTQDLGDVAIAAMRRLAVGKLPTFAQGIGGTVFDTLAHVVLGFIHKTPTTAIVSPAPALGFPPKVAAIPNNPLHFTLLAKVAQKQADARPAPSAMAASAAAMRAVAAAAKPATPAPPAPAALPTFAKQILSRGGSRPAAIMPVAAVAPSMPIVAPLAPLSLAIIVRTMQPQVIRHMVALPKGVRA